MTSASRTVIGLESVLWKQLIIFVYGIQRNTKCLEHRCLDAFGRSCRSGRCCQDI